MTRRLLLGLGIIGAGCGSKVASPSQSDVCRAYVECVGAVTPEALPSVIPTFGAEGTCWDSFEAADECNLACEQGLAQNAIVFPNEPACEGVGGSATDGSTGGMTSADTGDSSTGGPDPISPDQVDIVFVIDNSGSMGEEQGLYAQEAGAMADALSSAGIDWRVGFTTTDNGHPWCGDTSPEAGNLQATSCRTRQSEFVFNGAVPLDYTGEACLDHCSHDDIPLSKPWLEVVGGEPNWPADVSARDALACIGPQGINGCGFESHLESLYKAILRSETEGENQFGFLRPDTLTVVIMVSDEVDCSHNPDHESIFFPASEGGNQVFWSDPDAAFPTSAVCWNAGVECVGAGPTYDECNAVDLDVNGNPVGGAPAEDEAVLRPVSRYVDALTERPTLFAGILGVNANGQAVYADSTTDPQFQTDFGIGPGCQSAAGIAVPPVRMRELSEALGGTLYSVCSDDYGPIFTDIASSILARLEAE